MHPVFMSLLALQDGGGQIQDIARTFGVDWIHLTAQSVSFGIVCAVLYALAYKPVLRMLQTRREQIASGIAKAQQIAAERARTETERQAILAKAGVEGRQLIEDARAAAARVRAEEVSKAAAEAEQVLQRARDMSERERARMMADLKHEVGRLVVKTTESVTGKVLTAEDHLRLAKESAAELAL